MTKRQAQRRHANRRAFERYGMNLGHPLRSEIVAAIRSGRSRIVKRQSLRVSIHDVNLRDRTVRVVYDKKRGEIVTFLLTERLS